MDAIQVFGAKTSVGWVGLKPASHQAPSDLVKHMLQNWSEGLPDSAVQHPAELYICTANCLFIR
jgi:hypothetical protein